MTRIAIFADIHGNTPALEAVLDDIAQRQIDEVLVGGDMVGRGPEGTRVVRRIRELGFAAIGGNHEDYLIEFCRGDIPDSWRDSSDWAAARWMAAELDEQAASYIATLPFSIERNGLRLVHGTPASNRSGIGPWTDGEILDQVLSEIDENVLVCAHTHRALIHQRPAGMVVNVGSVGMPFNGDPRAQYAIFERETSLSPWGWRVELRQVDYDRGQIYQIYHSSGFLAAGGVTSRLLRMELEYAVPLLVPFLDWAGARGVATDAKRLQEFLAIHQPGDSLRQLYRQIKDENDR